MTKTFEQKLLDNILADTRKIFKDENTVTENYYDLWTYLDDIIDIVADSASEWLLTELYNLRDYYKSRYLVNKGLK